MTDASLNWADHSEFPLGTNVLSLQARRDMRRTVLAGDSNDVHAELRREQRRLKLVLELAREAVSKQGLRDLVSAIMTSIRGASISDGVCIFLRSPKEDELDVYALDFRSEGGSFTETTPLAGTIASHVLRTGKPWVGTRNQARASFQNELLLNEQFNTGCMLPLAGHNRFVGTLGLVRAQHNPYAQDELDFLIAVSRQIALALENALARQEISRLKDKLDQEKLYLEEEIRSELNFDQIVGDSPALRQVLELVQTVAPSDSTVLLLGETGTGKELVARAIHEHSRRKNRTFVKLNCAAIPTGAVRERIVWT